MRVLVAVSLGVAFALPGAANAAVGSLGFSDCVSSDAATTGCTNVSGSTNALDAVTHAVAISADGTSVYAAGVQDDVVHFARDLSTGRLTFKDCIAAGDSPATGCSNISATTNGLESPTAIAISGDDHDLYVAGLRAVVHLRRDGITGALSFADCISSDVSATDCTVPPGNAAISAFDALRLGSDDHSLYAAGGNRLVHLTRSSLDGSLLFTDCLSGGPVTGCADFTSKSNGFSSLESVMPSPDGHDLYVGANNAVYDLHLDASGTPSFGNCLASGPGASGCTLLSPSTAFQGLENVAISPDGANAYTTTDGGALSTLTRHGDGTLTFDSCITSTAVSGCTDVSATNGVFADLDGITVSADNRDVYATGAQGVAHLVRGSSGALTPADCLTRDPITGCASIGGQTNSLLDVQEVVLSPGGESAYVAAEASDSVLHLSRQLAPVCSAVTATVAHDTAATVALPCSDANGDALTRTITQGPSHGSLGTIDQAAGTVVYTPASGFAGADAFAFRATDGADESPSATASLTVGPGAAQRDTVAPVITRLSARATRRKRGGTVRFTLSEPAAVRVTIKRGAAGRRVGRACRKPTRANAKRKRCTRFVSLGSFTASGVAGPNGKRFAGKLARRKLRPGRYKVSARATDAAGNRSAARVATFRVR